MQQILASILIIATGLLIVTVPIIVNTDYGDHTTWLSNVILISFMTGIVVWATVSLTPILIILYSIIPN